MTDNPSPKDRAPIESFGAALFNILIAGSQRRIEVQTTYNRAVTLRLRCHRLRERMRKAGHPMFPVLARTRISIAWAPEVPTHSNKRGVRWPQNSEAPVTLSFSPHDDQFTDILTQIADKGVDLNRPVDLEPPAEGRGGSDPTQSLEDLLRDLERDPTK